MDLVRGASIACHDGRSFGLAIALQNTNSERQEEDSDIRIECCSPGDESFQPAAETSGDLLAHRYIEQGIFGAFEQREALRVAVSLAAERDCAVEQFRTQSALGIDAATNPVMQNLIEPRNGGHDRRPGFGQVQGDLFRALRIVNLRADGDWKM